ncbi:MAG TPA: hypothetical protein EYG93_04510 [Sulfurospirillum arcachonense]|nr:hypothetical protein [Sulfurospirillum arcachonense]HIP44581.1 hypothetical protein [Sulfurospirillum arcachonense]
MKKILILILPFLLGGCLYVNDRGIDTRYYNDCKEYYDSMGIYHKTCDENLIEYQDVKDGVKDMYKNTEEFVTQ